MWKLGNIEIDGIVGLAPMAGYTSSSYREFMSQFSPSFCYTEMISDMGLIYQNKETLDYLNFEKLNIPTGVQLFGFDPKNIAKAALIAQNTNKNIAFFDVNMACPVHKVNKNGAGCSLMNDPKKCGEIIRNIKRVTSKPVTAKIRLGFSDGNMNFIEVIKELENAGVDAIAIHARTAKDLYSGVPRLSLLEGLGKQMKVPLIISGNIFTVEDAKRAIEITNATAVLVARGGVGNPELITNIINGKEKPLNFEKQKEYCLSLAKMMVAEKGEERGIKVFRSIAPKFFTGFPNSKEIRKKLAMDINKLDDLINVLSSN